MYRYIGGLKSCKIGEDITIPKLVVLCNKKDLDILLNKYHMSVEKDNDDKLSIKISSRYIICNLEVNNSVFGLTTDNLLSLTISRNENFGTEITAGDSVKYDSVFLNALNSKDITTCVIYIQISNMLLEELHLNMEWITIEYPFNVAYIRDNISVFESGDVYMIKEDDHIDKMKLYDPISFKEYQWVYIKGTYLKDIVFSNEDE